MVPLESIFVEGRKESRSGRKAKSNHSIVPMQPLVDTTVRSGARMAFESCPEFGLKRHNFFISM